VATQLANPNWPALDVVVDFTKGPPSFATQARRSINAKYRRLAVRQLTISRGRQYELDQIQAGTLVTSIVDPLELLNPDNMSSPFNSGGNLLIPYRPIEVDTMWPNQPGSGNIINQNVSFDYDPSFELNPDGVLGAWGPADPSTALAQSTAQAFDGTHSLLVTQTAAGVTRGIFNKFRTFPDLTYTFSAYVRPTAGSVTIQVVDALGVVHTSATASTLNVWTRLSMTWNAADTLETITIYGTVAGAPTFYVDATQLEFGASPTAFTTTGPTLYVLFSGFVERYPTNYDMAGFRALRPLYSVDALAIMSRMAVNQSYNATVAADNPSIFIPWSNTSSATSGGALSTGSETAVVTAHNVQGDPNYFVPSTGSINWAGDQQLDGTPAVVITQQNANKPPGPGGGNQDTGVDILNGSFAFDTSLGGTIEMWAKPVVGQVSFGGVYSAAPGLQTNYASGIPNIVVESFPAGPIGFIYDPTGSNPQLSGQNLFPDNKWHYFAITVAGGTWKITQDTVEGVAGSPGSFGVIGFTYICHISANCGLGAPQSQVSFGRWAAYTRDIGATARQNHYQRGVGWINETSGSRVTRLLTTYWTALGGFASVAAGFLQMAPDFGYNGRVLLDVLQEIQESERGLIYVDMFGTVIFEDRNSRYANQTALWVFGENPVGASPVEYPYSAYETERDPTYTFSDANLSRPANNSFAPIVNTNTRTLFGQRVLTQTVQCVTDFDLTQAGIFYTQRYALPKTRITKLTLRPSANPALWPIIMQLELSQRSTVRRRNAGVTVSADYYIEKVDHRIDAETSAWETDLQVSPVFVPQAWVLGDATLGVLGTTTVPIY
jgi:hypothetical protein